MLSFNFDELWWGICTGFMQIIDWLDQAFSFLIGAVPMTENGTGGQSENISNLFVAIFNGDNGGVSMTKLYLYIMGACALLLGIFVAIGAIKSQFTKGATDSLAQMGEKTLFSILKMLFIPLVFLIALQATGYIFSFLVVVMGGDGSSSGIAEKLCDACVKVGGDIEKIDFNGDFDKMFINGETFNFLLCILACGCCVITLATVCFTLVKRIIEVFFYYLAAPVTLARTPLDDGKSFDLWKENVISKLLGAGGIIICMYLYFNLVPQFCNIVDSWAYPHGITEPGVAERISLAPILKILFIIGGSFVPASASMLFAQLISQGAGQNEANNAMLTQQMLGSGLKLAGGGIVAATKGGMKFLGGSVFNSSFGFGNKGGRKTETTNFSGNTTNGNIPTAIGGGIIGSGGGSVGTAAAISSNSPSATVNGSQPGGALADGNRAPSVATYTGQGVKGAIGGFFKGAGSTVGNAFKSAASTVKAGAVSGVDNMGRRTLGRTIGSTLVGVGIAGLKLGAASLMIVPNAIKGAVANTKFGRHRAQRKAEKKEGAAITRQANREAKLRSRKYESFDKKQSFGKTDDYLKTKFDNYDKRAGALEKKINSQEKKYGAWSDEKKQAYRRSQLGGEANRIQSYVNAAGGNLSEETLNRSKAFFNRMKTDLYGKNDGEKEGN